MSFPIPTERLITVRSRLPSARVFLRSPILTDALSLTKRANDPECNKFLPWLSNPKTPITVESNQKQVLTWQAESLRGEGWFLVVCLEADFRKKIAPYDGEPSDDAWATIGDSGMGPLKVEEKSGETGIMINSGAILRGQGLAVESLDLVFALGFDHLNLKKINLGTSKDNVPMYSLMEKRFGAPKVWREAQQDWEFVLTPEWWAKRQEEKGDARVVVDVETLEER